MITVPSSNDHEYVETGPDVDARNVTESPFGDCQLNEAIGGDAEGVGVLVAFGVGLGVGVGVAMGTAVGVGVC